MDREQNARERSARKQAAATNAEFGRIIDSDPSLVSLMHDMERSRQDQEAKAAQKDPRAYKRSRLFPDGVSASYRYHPAGKDGLGREVRFCWSCHRNVAGYFLGWRETISVDRRTWKRSEWVGRRVRRRAQELASRRAQRFQAKHSSKLPSAPAEVRP